MSILARSVKVAGRTVVYLAVGGLAAFVLLQAVAVEFTYYALFVIPILALWVIGGAIASLVGLDPRIGRAYLLGNAATLGVAVVFVIVLLIMSPETPSRNILLPALLLGLGLGIAAGALLPGEWHRG